MQTEVPDMQTEAQAADTSVQTDAPDMQTEVL